MKKPLIDVIFASEKRKNVLVMLHDGIKEMETILEELGTTRQALLPQIRILENHHLIYQSGDAYGLTTIGKIIVDEMKPFLDKIDTLDENRNYLKNHNIDCIPGNIFKRINEIKECKVIEPGLVDTYEINKDFIEKALKSHDLFFVFTFVHPSFSTIFRQFVEKNINVTVILTEELLQKLKNEWPEELKKFMIYENSIFYLYKNDIKISSLAISDQCFVLRLLFSNNEFSSKQLFCCDPEAMRWGKDLFTHYLNDCVELGYADVAEDS